MALNRTARGIVLVPSLLLGGAFLATAAWLDGPAAANRPLALGLGAVLIGTGLLTQLLPDEAAIPASSTDRDRGEASVTDRKDQPRSGDSSP